MSERTNAAFKDMAMAKMAAKKEQYHGPETDPPRHVIKCYQYQIEKALDQQWGELFVEGHTVMLLETHLHEYWQEQHGPYRKHKPEVISTPNGFVVNLGDFQIAEYNNVISR